MSRSDLLRNKLSPFASLWLRPFRSPIRWCSPFHHSDPPPRAVAPLPFLFRPSDRESLTCSYREGALLSPSAASLSFLNSTSLHPSYATPRPSAPALQSLHFSTLPSLKSTSLSAAAVPGASRPEHFLVVQPRLRPDWLLRSRLEEALRLVEALCAREAGDAWGRKARSNSTTAGRAAPKKVAGERSFNSEDEGVHHWWPVGVSQSSPWVVVGHAQNSSAQRRLQRERASPSSISSFSVSSSLPAFFGKGTVETIAAHVAASDSQGRPLRAVFVNESLSGSQQRNLEQAWGRRVVGRVGLIIDIFGAHASTREAQLQLELAKLAYQRSRLVRVQGRKKGASKGGGGGGGRGEFGDPESGWEVVSAKGRGGAGGRGFLSGAGESELQVQRTRLTQRQHRLRQLLEDVRRTRALHRSSRRRGSAEWGGRGTGMPVVAVVGYTNAGKSTLVSSLSGSSQLLGDDSLFATLDPRVRAMRLPSGRKILLSDTVGFIADLPPELVEAFRATLEEVVAADLLLHVVDGSAEDRVLQRQAVMEVLRSLGDQRVEGSQGAQPVSKSGTIQTALPIIEAWNKADLMPHDHNETEDPRTNMQDGAGLSTEINFGTPTAAKEWTRPPKWEDLATDYYMQTKKDVRILPLEEDEEGMEGPIRVETSALTGHGLDKLLRAIDETLRKRGF